jgi:hypothetical protein
VLANAGNGSRGGGFREQYDRMMRWFERFKRVNDGQQQTDDIEYHEDTMRAFFENCFHLRDWIKNDSKSGIPTKDVEDFITKTRYMKLCADVAISYKHMIVTKTPRSGENPTLGPRHFTLSTGRGPPYGQVNYTISTRSGPRDAFQLAGECVDAWKAFLGRQGHSS